MAVPTELSKRDSDMKTVGHHDMKQTTIHTFCTVTHSYIRMWSFLLSIKKFTSTQVKNFGTKTTPHPSLLWCGVQVNMYLPNAESLSQNNIKKQENKTCPVGAAISEKDSVYLTGGQRPERCTKMSKCTRQSRANKTVGCCALTAQNEHM